MLKRWSTYIDRARNIGDVDTLLRSKWINAIKHLQKELGYGFLKNAPNDHPLILALHNSTSGGKWAIETLIEIAETLSYFKSASDTYSKLHGKLTSARLCRAEGMPFIEVVTIFRNKNYQIELLHEDPQNKNADMSITDRETQDKFYLEVSRINNSSTVEESQTSYDALFRKFPMLDVPYSFHQVTNFNEAEIGDVIQTIFRVRTEAINANGIVFFEDGKIKLAISPAEQRKELEQWCFDNNMRLGLHGVPLDFNETKRIANNKIKRKSIQIKANSSGLIFIPVSALYFFVNKIDDAICEIQDGMKKYLNVVGVVLWGSCVLDPGENHREIGKEYIYLKRIKYGCLLRHVLFIQNPAYRGLLKNDTIENIRRCVLTI